MRRSAPITAVTSLMSAPVRSQSAAMAFTKLSLVARKALQACLASSADSMPVSITRWEMEV